MMSSGKFFKLMNKSCYGQMMVNERDFKRGIFCQGRKKGISKRKMALSNPKMNSMLTVGNENGEDHIKTKLPGKGIDKCCIDDAGKGIDKCCIDDASKRSTKVEEREGGVIEMKIKLPDKKYKNITLIRHANMKDCVLHGIKGPDVEAWRIETIKQYGPESHKMVTRKHDKKPITMYDDKRYLLANDYHSLAYGHKDCGELVPMSKVREMRFKKLERGKVK